MRRASLPAARKSRYLRFAAIAAATAGLSYLSLVTTLANVSRNRAPETALRFQPNDAQAMSNYAALLLLANPSDSATRKHAVELATRSVTGLALNPTALRVLLIREDLLGKASRERALLDQSERLSRRDVMTQLLLIESEVQRDSVEGALRHYDRALRVDPTIGASLFPVLAAAGAGPVPDAPFIRLFKSAPPWTGQFVEWALRYAPDLPAITPLLLTIEPTPDTFPAEYRQEFVARLVKEKHYAEAFRFYGAFTRDRQQAALWGPQPADPLPPLDWEFASNGRVSLDVSTVDKATSLSFDAEGSLGDTIAARVIALTPGRYAMSVLGTTNVGNVAQAPRLRLECAAEPAIQLAALPLMNGTGGQKSSEIRFEISAACPYQRVALQLQSIATMERQTGSINDVRIRKLN